METKDRDKLIVAAEKAKVKCIPGLHDGEIILKADTVIALLDALDEAEKLWDHEEWPVQTHMRSKTMAEHIEKIKCLFGDELSPWIKITPTTPIPKDGKEYLTCNTRQGSVMRLVYWDAIHKRWKCKSHHLCSLHETHYQPITLPEKG